MTSQIFKGFLGVCTTFLLSTPCWAQFQGDVFFEVPSVRSAQGGVVSFNVQAFSGAAALGAAQLEVLYDPAFLKLLSADEPDTAELGNDYATNSSPGKVAMIALNTISDIRPFGTVTLGTLQFEVLGEPGSVIPVVINAIELLDTDALALPSVRGFSGDVLVESNAAPLVRTVVPTSGESDADAIVSSNSELGRRAMKMRPVGERVELETVSGTRSVFVRD